MSLINMKQELIEKALQLTGKTMEDMEVVSGVIYQKEELTYRFSIEKFCYYLLSPEFIKAYADNYLWRWKTYTPNNFVSDFWIAIYEYQDWHEQTLSILLSKICQ